MNEIDKSNLGYIGEEFQYSLCKQLTEDKDLFKELNSIINQNMFTDPNLKIYVGVMKEYYKTFECVPSYDLIKMEMFKKSHNSIEHDIYDAVVNKIKSFSTDGQECIKDTAIKFFMQQNLIKAANEVLRIAGSGNFEQYNNCKDIITKAINICNNEVADSKPFDNINETLSDDYRIAIPTGIKGIDKTLEGGLGKGEIGVIIGSSSFGKTSLTTAIAGFASTFKCAHNNDQGFKVLQIVFEDRIKQIQRKHFGRITEIEAKDLGKPEFINIVKEKLKVYPDREMMENNLRIIRLPSGERTAWDIEKIIKQHINNGFSPDLVIVDYFECVASKRDAATSSEWSLEGNTMRKFESISGELNIAIWIPLQGTKDSFNAELVTMDKAGGSVKKIQASHIILSISRTMEDIENNKATLSVLKNRAGGAGKVFPNADFNNGTCIISTDNCDETSDSMYRSLESAKIENDTMAATKKIFEGRQK